ncbi:glutathione S-transferase 1-1-like [Anopheles ziemanni]|uniref:glutathione S-transferase 1-1-like n=1 Tax=Anopheles coustani TaxID=139045 RepID=UPI00265880B7|nr:glutathione S-transferase 1-1-like [Anopheles coustani]XP_058171882.1 glutathione S-transferase 1-1-like [Anopheles ziemanni]
MPTPTLYYFPMSPPARAVLLLVKELGLTVNLKEVDPLAGETRTEEFMRINPEHTIPALDDNGFYLGESRAILTYLVDAYRPGHSLYPNIPKEKALINRVLHHDLGAFYPKFFSSFGGLFSGAQTEITDENRATAHKALTDLENYLVRNDFFAGENPTVADLSLLPMIATAVHCGLDLTKYKRLNEWYENCRQLKGYEDDQEVARQIGVFIRSKFPAGLEGFN